ncbi:alpha/beta hydrolase [Phenylobacterium sp.]|jgi:poly(3-hydroxybutyrate) depolymerase|uniref:alpha/beta hydrolase n=1 Tax=Phenylobacterium sp. TaxID=1871053 RepID=UPI002E2F83C7|nr:alpha/beta hydrolase [Phenylobacterium sp.]HEX2560490.1 alpha/beta hydrolase [Phenylobacterium sp.]
MKRRVAIRVAAAAGAVALLAGPAATQTSDNTNGQLRCPPTKCPGELVINPGTVVDAKTGRKFFLDYPKDWKPGDKVTFVLNLHGGGSYGNWQRHYFPIVDYVDKYDLVVATPNAPPRVWRAEDDPHLQNIVEMAEAKFGKQNIQRFWLAGHSQGGATSRRIVCSDFFRTRVDGFLSLSGGRVGGQPGRPSGPFRAPQRGEPAAPATPPAAASSIAQAMAAPLTCDFSHIYTTGEHEITALPQTSEWATKYGCGPRVRRSEIFDTTAGYVYDSGRQDPATKAWGRLPGPGKAEVFLYPNCRDGRVVADVVRIDKGHTEGLEPRVTEELVKLMLSADG